MRPAWLHTAALAAGLLAAAASAGCAARATPYRFAGPMTGTVALSGPSWAEVPGTATRGHPAASLPPRTPAAVAVPGASGFGLAGPDARVVTAVRVDGTVGVDLVADDGSPMISGLRAPNFQKKAKPGVAVVEVGAAHDPAGLRALVGDRDGRGDVAFALAAAAALRGPLPDDVAAVTDGPALVEVARGRGALAAPTDPDRAVRVPDAGDLLVFDRAQGGKPASLIAVVLGVDERGVIEMMYLAGGVIRRGFVSPAHPGRKRDDAGRILNTSMRHGNDQPPRGTHYLSGELLAGVVGVAALAR